MLAKLLMWIGGLTLIVSMVRLFWGVTNSIQKVGIFGLIIFFMGLVMWLVKEFAGIASDYAKTPEGQEVVKHIHNKTKNHIKQQLGLPTDDDPLGIRKK